MAIRGGSLALLACYTEKCFFAWFLHRPRRGPAKLHSCGPSTRTRGWRSSSSSRTPPSPALPLEW